MTLSYDNVIFVVTIRFPAQDLANNTWLIHRNTSTYQKNLYWHTICHSTNHTWQETKNIKVLIPSVKNITNEFF